MPASSSVLLFHVIRFQRKDRVDVEVARSQEGFRKLRQLTCILSSAPITLSYLH